MKQPKTINIDNPSLQYDEKELLDFYQRLRQKIRKQTAEPPKWTKGRSLAPLVEYLVLLPDLFHLAVKLMFDSRVTWQRKVILGGAIAYVMNPFDIIPDVIPVVGQLDDLFIIAKALNYFFNAEDAEIQAAIRQHWAGNAKELEQVQGLISLSETMLSDFPAGIKQVVEKLGLPVGKA